MEKLKESTRNGLATETTRNIEKMIKKVCDKNEIHGFSREATLRDKFQHINKRYTLDSEVVDHYKSWSRTRNDYTHATTDHYEIPEFKEHYYAVIKGLDTLIKKESDLPAVVGGVSGLTLIGLVYYFWDSIVQFIENIF